jgi:hypothetical protein
MPTDGLIELSFALIPVNKLHETLPTTKGTSTSWAGGGGSVLLFLPLFFSLTLETYGS